MPSESGDMKLLGNFSKLIEPISTSPDYKPVCDADNGTCDADNGIDDADNDVV